MVTEDQPVNYASRFIFISCQVCQQKQLSVTLTKVTQSPHGALTKSNGNKGMCEGYNLKHGISRHVNANNNKINKTAA